MNDHIKIVVKQVLLNGYLNLLDFTFYDSDYIQFGFYRDRNANQVTQI